MGEKLVLDLGGPGAQTPVGVQDESEAAMTDALTTALELFALPGEAVFPESVGVDPRSGSAYVGSLADGTIYRIDAAGTVEVASVGGADERRSVAGIKVDDEGRLWAAGGYEGTLHVYEAETLRLRARFDVGGRPSCVNDVAFDDAGTAYVTDSLIPALFRVGRDLDELERWVDLSAAGLPWPDGLNLNGIVLTPDGRHLVTCQTNLGRFWRVALDDGGVDEVELEGGPLEHCDGLAIEEATLYAAINARDEIAVIDLAADGSSGRVRRRLRSGAFAFPTAVAISAGRLLVVNGQLDKMGGAPELPFTVAAVGTEA
jgi:Cu-Zn family superoxide dismutase